MMFSHNQRKEQKKLFDEERVDTWVDTWTDISSVLFDVFDTVSVVNCC